MTGGVRRHLVVGTAGGVGTTTVTALLFAQLQQAGHGAPLLADHTAGSLGPRVPGGDEVEWRDSQMRVYDMGCNVLASAAELADPEVSLFLVTAATPADRDLADEEIRAIAHSAGTGAVSRTVLVLAEVFGRYRLRGHRFGDRIPLNRLSRRTRRAMQQLAETQPRRADPQTTARAQPWSG